MPLFVRFIISAILVCLIGFPAGAKDKRGEARALFPIEQNGKWGYIDLRGNIVIPPRLQAAREFSEGLASVEVGGKWGFIDEQGEMAIEPVFSGASGFSEGLARVQVGGDKYGMYGKWGFIDPTGRMVIEPMYEEFDDVAETSYDFHEGLAMIEINYRKGFIDRTGKVVIEPQFQFAYHFTEGLASVSKGLSDKWGYIDRSGQWAIPPKFDQASSFSEGLAPVELDGVCGFTDRRGDLKLRPDFQDRGDCAVVWGSFNDGLSRWKMGERYGYIDRSGRVAIQPRFSLTDEFSEGMAYVEQDGKYGFVNSSGNMAIEPQFYLAESFHNGLARVDNGTRDSWGYIDKAGTFVWKTAPAVPSDSEPAFFAQVGHTNDILFVGWSPDGNALASYSAGDGWIKLWNPWTGRLLWSLKPHDLKRNTPATSPDGLLTASAVSGEAYEIRDAKTNKVIVHINAHSTSDERVTGPDGSIVAERGRYGDACIRLFDAETNSLIRRLEGHPGIIKAVAYSPDGKVVASGSGDRTVRLWDAQTGRLIKTIVGHTRDVTAVAFSSDGSTLVSASEDDTIRIWDVAGSKLIRSFPAFTSGLDGVKSVGLSPSGQMIVASSGVQVKVFETASGKSLRTFETDESHTNASRTICCGSDAHSATFSPDGKSIVSGHEDGTIKLWDLGSARLVRSFATGSSEGSSVTLSADGKLIASGSESEGGRIALWSARTGKLLRRFGPNSEYVRSLAFSPDGRMIVSGHILGVKLWDARNGRLVREFPQGFSENDQVAFSPDGRHVVSGGVNQNLLLWDADNGRLIWGLIPRDLETQDERAEEAKIEGALQAERKRRTREADARVAQWKNRVLITFDHFGAPINPLEQHLVDTQEPRKRVDAQSATQATGVWLRFHNASPLPISFQTDSLYLPRPNCGVEMSNGARAGLCEGMEVSIRYQLQEANGKPVPNGIDVSSVSVLAPGGTVMFSVPLTDLDNSRVIHISYTYMQENEKHGLEEYGSARRVNFRGSRLPLK